jgi:hypothetical protein
MTISSATAYQQPAGGGGGAIAKLKGFRAKHSLSRTPHLQRASALGAKLNS